MLGRGDWKKIEDSINAVLEPMGRRLKAMEKRMAEIEEALEAAKGAPQAKAPAKRRTGVVKDKGEEKAA